VNRLPKLTSSNSSRELKTWMLEREITSLRWMVATFLGAQIVYFTITLSAVWFLITHR